MKITKGFTLIELLVVISIIGVLATVVLSSLGKARNRSEDSARVQTMKQIELALELYYLDNNEYPQTTGSFGVNNGQGGIVNGTGNNTNQAALDFISDISPYIKNININEVLLGDSDQWGTFYYKSTSDNNYQSYGSMLFMVDYSNKAAIDDGGYWPSTTDTNQHEHTGGSWHAAFEIGEDPGYCREKYFSSIFGDGTTRCRLGS